MSRATLTSGTTNYPLTTVGASSFKDLTWFVLGSFYLFVFTIPFNFLGLGLGSLGMSTLVGYLFIFSTILKPRLCYKMPGSAFWCFAIYQAVNLLYVVIEHGAVSQVFTRAQLLIMFWITSNLLRHDNRILRTALYMLAVSGILLAFFLAAGSAAGQRATALEQNPNQIAVLLLLGLVAVVGLAYGREETSRKARIMFWLFSPFILLGIVRTGSRGAILTLLAALGVFLFKRARLLSRVKMWAIALISIVFVVVAVFNIEFVWSRFEMTIFEGDFAGRDQINAAAIGMVVQKPFLGWGPTNHERELGSRLGLPYRGFHNLYLHVLTEVGFIGALPFFGGIFLCLLSAWKARKTVQGVVPLAMLVGQLVLELKTASIYDRNFWFVLAFAVACGTYPVLARGVRFPQGARVFAARTAGVPRFVQSRRSGF